MVAGAILNYSTADQTMKKAPSEASKPNINVMERLSWVLYQGHYWWPSIVYQDYHEFFSHSQGEMDEKAKAQVSLEFLNASVQQQGNNIGSLRVARLLGRPSFEFVFMPDQEDSSRPTCRQFHTSLATIVSSQACKPTRIPQDLYLDFHRGLDHASALLYSGLSGNTLHSYSGANWLSKAEQLVGDGKNRGLSVVKQRRDRLVQPVDFSPAGDSIAAVSLSDSYVSASGNAETTLSVQRETSNSVEISTPSPRSRQPPALEGSPIPRHASWNVVWDKLIYNGWSCHKTPDGAMVYSPPPTDHGPNETWDLERVQDYARQNYGWAGAVRLRKLPQRHLSRDVRSKRGHEAANTQNVKRPKCSDHDEFYDFKNLWEDLLKPHGWHYKKTPKKLGKHRLVDWVMCTPDCSSPEDGEYGRDFFQTREEVVEFCKKEHYYEKYAENDEVNFNWSDSKSSSILEKCDEFSNGASEDSERDSEMGDSSDEESVDSLDESEEENEEDEEDNDGGEEFLTPKSSKTTPLDPGKPRLSTPGSCSSLDSNLATKPFPEIWDYLRSVGWKKVRARSKLEDWWYVKWNGSVSAGIDGIDYFRTDEAVREYVKQAESANRLRSSDRLQKIPASLSAVKNSRLSSRRKNSTNLVQRGVPEQNSLSSYEAVDPLSNDAPWNTMPMLSATAAWKLCQAIGASYKNGIYYLPDQSKDCFTARFRNLDELRSHFCSQGIPNFEKLGSSIDEEGGFSEQRLFQNWVAYANVPVCGEGKLQAMRLIENDTACVLLSKLGISTSGSGENTKWISPVPLSFRGVSMTYFGSLVQLRLFVRGIEDLEREVQKANNPMSVRRSRMKITPMLSPDELLALRLWAAAAPTAPCLIGDYLRDVVNYNLDLISGLGEGVYDARWRPVVDDLISRIPQTEEVWKLLKMLGVKHSNGIYHLPPDCLQAESGLDHLIPFNSPHVLAKFLCRQRRDVIRLNTCDLTADQKECLYLWIATAYLQLHSWTPVEEIPTLSDRGALELLESLGVRRIGGNFFLAGASPSNFETGVDCFRDLKDIRLHVRTSEDLENAFRYNCGEEDRRRRQPTQGTVQPIMSEMDVLSLRLWSLAAQDPLECLAECEPSDKEASLTSASKTRVQENAPKNDCGVEGISETIDVKEGFTSKTCDDIFPQIGKEQSHLNGNGMMGVREFDSSSNSDSDQDCMALMTQEFSE